MKAQATRVVSLCLMIILAIILFLCSGCKKEPKEECGTCDFFKHYSHNDSTYEFQSNSDACGSGYSFALNFDEQYNDTINNQPTTIHEYSVCQDK